MRFLMLLFCAIPVLGQVSGPGGPTFSAGLLKLFGEHTAFTADVHARALDPKGAELIQIPMTFYFLDGVLKVEADLSTMTGSAILPGVGKMLKEMGLDKVITLIQPSRKSSLVIYPGIRSYAEVPLPPEEQLLLQNASIEIKKMGPEPVDGKPAEKQQVTIAGPNDARMEALVWVSAQERNFPVQIHMKDEDANTIVLRFRNIKFEKPDSKNFTAPPGYARYDDAAKMIQDASSRKLR